ITRARGGAMARGASRSEERVALPPESDTVSLSLSKATSAKQRMGLYYSLSALSQHVACFGGREGRTTLSLDLSSRSYQALPGRAADCGGQARLPRPSLGGRGRRL